MTTRLITVFGGATPQPGEPAYDEAYRLGGLLGAAGYTVLTGGYSGTMEAVSRGAAEAGAHVIGVTCTLLEQWRPLGANRWVMEEIRHHTLRARMYDLIDRCDAALALPGGIGTLAEIAATWSGIQTGDVIPKPLILIGPGWRATFDAMLAEFDGYVSPAYRTLIDHAPDVDAALALLRTRLHPPIA